MKTILSLLCVAFAASLAQADTETIISRSAGGVFELVEVYHPKEDFKSYKLRDAKSKKEIVDREDENSSGDDFINPGFGSPVVEWHPTNSMLFIVNAKLYRDRGYEYAVFRITKDLKLLRVGLPEEAIPERWNPDGSIVLLVKREATFIFDSEKNTFQPTAPNKSPK